MSGPGPAPGRRIYHLTLWHTDERKKAGRPDGWGFGATVQHPVGGLLPFLRYGYSDGGAAMLEHLVMGGVTWTNAFEYKQDAVGVALAWGRPSNPELDDQLTGELYYKMQLTRRLAVTPAVQLLLNPSANPDANLIAVFGS